MSATATEDSLRRTLLRIDGRGYGAYKDIRGTYGFADFTLAVDAVQGDPFAAPSRLRVLVPPATAELPARLYSSASRAIGVSCLLAKAFAIKAGKMSTRRGSGKSGEIRIEAPGQQVLANTAVQVHDDGAVEARFTVGLPAQGRRVLGRQACGILLEDLPELIAGSLYARSHTNEELWRHAAANEDADTLRAAMAERGLIAFVADGSILPRSSGVDDRPMQGGSVIPFRSPDSLKASFSLPNAGAVSGMGVAAGVTLIVGGGYHGKSTLLRAIEKGVYNHRPGDGRELVVSKADLVKIRAEDGRAVSGVDISAFIGDLPLGQSTRSFASANASGSTSQAATIVEAMEAGAGGLLIDEDTAATNFLIRDARMQALVPKESEPITPYIDRVGRMYKEYGISTVLVVGGSGDYLDVADTVIAMETFRPNDVTARASAVASDHPTGRVAEGGKSFNVNLRRIPRPGSVDPSKGRRESSIRTRDMQTVQFGRETLDLAAVEQIVHWGQTRAIGAALDYARGRYIDGRRSLSEILDLVMADIEAEGLDVLERRRTGEFAQFRRHELAAAFNRLRSFRT
ncbi:MAG: ABC-ATPase domain-containing protein [Caldilineaceae bacterium SB0675_bin_29]|uniref:ABC-ATPase domain-containing protein n=1 Tax=Caldilineaceae bacterium SB0675_bin_29 TaxID=2605266 RepID=A0A6B1FY10_9CHLR|nr:ABC-ATPase domain-containing protein [Caldilineaceae bacterium SB0675_bin_29]